MRTEVAPEPVDDLGARFDAQLLAIREGVRDRLDERWLVPPPAATSMADALLGMADVVVVV